MYVNMTIINRIRSTQTTRNRPMKEYDTRKLAITQKSINTEIFAIENTSSDKPIPPSLTYNQLVNHNNTPFSININTSSQCLFWQ